MNLTVREDVSCFQPGTPLLVAFKDHIYEAELDEAGGVTIIFDNKRRLGLRDGEYKFVDVSNKLVEHQWIDDHEC